LQHDLGAEAVVAAAAPEDEVFDALVESVQAFAPAASFEQHDFSFSFLFFLSLSLSGPETTTDDVENEEMLVAIPAVAKRATHAMAIIFFIVDD